MTETRLVSRPTLAMEVVALAAALQVVFLVVIVFVFVLPSLAQLRGADLLRLTLLPIVLAASVVVAYLALRWAPGRRLAWFWLLAAIPSLVMLVAFLQVFSSGFSRPQRLADFAPDVVANLVPLVLISAAAISFLEVRRGSAMRAAPATGRGRLLAYGAPVAAVAIAILAINLVASAAQPGRTSGRPGGNPSPSTQSNGGPEAVGETVSSFVMATVPALPDGTLYVNISRLDGGPPAAEPGIEFDTGSRTSVFEPAGVNGPTAKGVIFFSVRLTGQRSSAPGTSVYTTADLPPVPRINQTEGLKVVNLAPRGRSARLTSHGVEVIYVLQGTVTVDAGTLPPNTVLGQGKAAFVLDNTGVQVVNKGTGVASYVAFFVARDPTNLESPSG